MKTNYDFIKNMIGLQGIEIISTNVSNGVFQVFATSTYSFAICTRCKCLTRKEERRCCFLPQVIARGNKLKVEAVSMDMSRGYCSSILEFFPNAKPVIDRFRLAHNFQKCVDDARKHIQNHIQKHGKKNEVFKIRWALLKHVEDIITKTLQQNTISKRLKPLARHYITGCHIF